MPRYGRRFKKVVDEAKRHPDYWIERMKLSFFSVWDTLRRRIR